MNNFFAGRRRVQRVPEVGTIDEDLTRILAEMTTSPEFANVRIDEVTTQFTETLFNKGKIRVSILFNCSVTVFKGSRTERPPKDQIDLEVNPIHLIRFKDLRLTKIEAAIKVNDESADAGTKVNLRPLRNYLVTKQEDQENSDCVLALVFSKITGSQSTELFLQVKINHVFLQRLTKVFKNPAISIMMTQEGHFGSTNTLVSRILFKNNEPAGVQVSDLLTSGPNSGTIILNVAKGRAIEGAPTRSNTYSLFLNIHLDNVPMESKPLQSNANSLLLKLYGMDDSAKDFTIFARNGVEVKCHKSILMAQSESFASLLSPGHILANENEFHMDNNSEESVRLFVKFLYGLEILLEENIGKDPALALELLQMANAHGVQSLESCLAEFLSQMGMNYFTLDTILELFVCSEVPETLKELNAHAFAEISTIPVKTLRSCEYFNQASQTAQEILFRLLLKLHG